MKIEVIGGGPGGLYFALLAKKADPARRVTVRERNRPDDTFGFGVVFSDQTLGHFRGFDEESYRAITGAFAYWDEIDVHVHGEVVRSRGHGFCGMGRKELLRILHARCRALGVELRFEEEVASLDALADADLIVAADGVNSAVRERLRDDFLPRVDERPNRFVWLGSTRDLPAFTFVFREDAAGIWNLHAYRYAPGRSTFIVETTEDAWRRAGMDRADEAATVRYLEALLADHLDGHRLITNRSVWRRFPMIRCRRWSSGNVALLGDAAHTAHFSVGSGTKMAMEDAAALADAIGAHRRVPDALVAYEAARRPDVERLQHAADVSLDWFENVRRFWRMHPVQLSFSLLSRSRQITYENLELRDPAFVRRVDRWFAGQVAGDGGIDVPPDPPPPPMFTPLRLRDLVLDNRVVVSPMCQYSAVDGTPGEWHFVHLGSRAVGGAALVFTEMTNVAPDARITPGCTGMYRDEHVEAWRRIVAFIHAHTRAKVCLQLGHAGRKGATRVPWEGEDEPLGEGAWPLVSASPLPYLPHSQVPREMDRADMDRVRDQFVRAARMAEQAGFDMLEIHMAHGYLLASFLSPLTNRRADRHGGALDNRLRYPLEVFDAVRAVWPARKPMSVRISATDWVPHGGLSGEDSVAIARAFQSHGCDLINVSAGQTTPEQQPVYGRMFQTPFADRIRNEAGVPTMAVGNITTPDQVNTVVAAGRADLVALARPHLADPSFTLRASAHYRHRSQPWPVQYLPGRDQAFRLAERAREELRDLRLAARPASHRRGE